MNASLSGSVEDAGHVVHLAGVLVGLHAERNFAFVLVGRRARREVQRAAERVSTEIGALRTAQHLDALHVDQHRVRHAIGHRRDAELVEIVADGVHEGVLARHEVVDAADRDVRGRGCQTVRLR